MSLRPVTLPTTHPVTIEEIKDWLRVEGVDDEADLLALRADAELAVEEAINRPLMTQTWELVLDAFPSGPIEIPMSPLESITSVTYTDVDGNSQTWDSSEYVVVRAYASAPRPPDAARGLIEPGSGFAYPSTQDVPEAVVIRFVCGYGTTPSDVPEPLRVELRRFVGFKFENREGNDKPNIATSLASYRAWSF